MHQTSRTNSTTPDLSLGNLIERFVLSDELCKFVKSQPPCPELDCLHDSAILVGEVSANAIAAYPIATTAERELLAAFLLHVFTTCEGLPPLAFARLVDRSFRLMGRQQ